MGGVDGSADQRDFWAITTFFNPAGYQRRIANYRLFREHLNLPLLAVELSFTGDFSLSPDDADILIRLQKGDILWQKERLLNIAARLLPPACRTVAWIDCDLIFERSDWAERADRLLDHFPMVQAFGEVFLMPPGWGPDMPPNRPEHVRHPPAFYVEHGVAPLSMFRHSYPPIPCSPGLAWVARRQFLEAFRLYEGCIVGGGDSGLGCAVFGCFDSMITIQLMNEPRRDHYMSWAMPLHKEVNGNIGYVDGAVYHLWHGTRANRKLTTRHQTLEMFDFDPWKDIAAEIGEAWQWSSNKPGLHSAVKDYFIGRREDD